MLESLLHRALGNFVEHHTEGRHHRLLGHDLFSQMLTDRFAFTIRVGGEINGSGGLGGLLQIGNNPFVVAFLRVGNDFVFRLKMILHIHAETFRRQVFDMPDRGHHNEVLAQVFIDRFRLGGRFDYDEVLCHYLFNSGHAQMSVR